MVVKLKTAKGKLMQQTYPLDQVTELLVKHRINIKLNEIIYMSYIVLDKYMVILTLFIKHSVMHTETELILRLLILEMVLNV